MEVSDCPEYLIFPNGDCISPKGNLLTPKIEKNGYPRYHLYNAKEKKHYYCLIHRLVAKAFIPNPENKPEVDHIDRNTLNCDISNLRWVTILENRHNREKKGCIEKNYQRYRARIQINNCLVHIGCFDTKKEAQFAIDDYFKQLSK